MLISCNSLLSTGDPLMYCVFLTHIDHLIIQIILLKPVHSLSEMFVKVNEGPHAGFKGYTFYLHFQIGFDLDGIHSFRDHLKILVNSSISDCALVTLDQTTVVSFCFGSLIECLFCMCIKD